MSPAPWASGPREILQHGLSLLRSDSDTNRRLAMLSIDNAVELMIKTYLGLPQRVTGIPIGDRPSAHEPFPRILERLERHAAEKIEGVDLGEIEWYHTLRNELYHQGNGLTVEREKVEVYAELAQLLFKGLFGSELLEETESDTGDDVADVRKEFLFEWADLERALARVPDVIERMGETPRPVPPLALLQELAERQYIDQAVVQEIEGLQVIRNRVGHAEGGAKNALRAETVQQVKAVKRALIGMLSRLQALAD